MKKLNRQAVPRVTGRARLDNPRNPREVWVFNRQALIMKARNLPSRFPLRVLALAAALAVPVAHGSAQDSSPAASAPPPSLSHGVAQVLQLSQAKVSDNVIVQYIQNSGTIYPLSAQEIVYLKQQGVSDAVLNAMLDQRRRITGSSEPRTPTAPASAQNTTTSTADSAPTVTYVETTPAYVPSSTVYIIPDTQTYNYYVWYHRPYYYPYVSPYCGWVYPGVTISWGFGGRWGGYYHPGFHGGWHHR